MPEVKVTHFTDPTCPFAYSAIPAVSVLRWRYGSQLEWELVTIGLSESPERYEANGYTPTRMAVGHLRFRRHGMPLLSLPRERIAASTRACRAIVATRLLFAGREEDVLRALQLSAFTSTLMLDRDEDLAEALAVSPGYGRHDRHSFVGESHAGTGVSCSIASSTSASGTVAKPVA